MERAISFFLAVSLVLSPVAAVYTNEDDVFSETINMQAAEVEVDKEDYVDSEIESDNISTEQSGCGQVPDTSDSVESDIENNDDTDQQDSIHEQDMSEQQGEPDELECVENDAETDEDFIPWPYPDGPFHEIIPAPDIEYGTITETGEGAGLRQSRAVQTRKISTLKEKDTVMIPLTENRTLQFRVIAKDVQKFGTGVVLSSTQCTAQVTYVCGNTASGPNTFTQQTGGSYSQSIIRDYLTNTFYNELHPQVKPQMKKAKQSEWYHRQSYLDSPSIIFDEYYDYEDYVFIPSSFEATINGQNHAYLGQPWGDKMDFSLTNSDYRSLRNRFSANYAPDSNNNKNKNANYYYGYYLHHRSDVGTSINYWVIGWGHYANQTCTEYAVPCILLKNEALIFDGKDGPELVINSPPTEPGTIASPSNVNAWQSSSITFTWGASKDPDGDAITYVVERSINGGAFKQVTTTTGRSYSHTIGKSDNNVRIRVKARDPHNEESGYTTSGYTYITHNSPPTTPTNLKPKATVVNSWETSTVLYTWSASTDADKDSIKYVIEHNINNSGWVQTSTTSELSYSHAISSTHDSVQIRILATDGKEPSGYATSALTTIIHDTSNPTISLTAAPDSSSGWTASDIVITAVMANALSPLDRLEVPQGVTPVGTVTLSGKTAIQTFTANNVGDYAFTVYNKAGLSATGSVSVGNVDQVPPVIAYTTSTPDGEFTNGNVDIHFTLSDTLSGLQRFVTPAGAVELDEKNASYTYTVTQNSAPTFTLLDNVFNSVSVNIIINMIDRIKPAIKIDSDLKRWNNNANATLHIRAADDYSGVANVRLPDGSLCYEDDVDFQITQNGIYTVSASDRAGNLSDEASIDYYWFDRTPPTIISLRFVPVESLIRRFFSLFGNIVSNKSIQMDITYDDIPTGTDSESGVKWIYHRVFTDSGELVEDWTATSAGASMPRIDNEVNGYVEVFVEDAAGNRSDVATFEILIDKTPPETSYTVSETEITNQPVTAALTVTDEAGGSGFKGWLLPDGGVLVSQQRIEYTFTENAVKTFVALDNAGNRTDVVIAVGNIDLYPPVITGIDIEKVTEGSILGVIANLFVKSAFNTKIRVTVNATDDIEVDRIMYCVTSGADIPDGAEWFVMRGNSVEFEQEMSGVFHAMAVDKACNESEIASRAIIIDRSPPVISYELKDRENEYEPVTIRVTAADDTSAFGVSGISHITNPHGEPIHSGYTEYHANRNGSYMFTATDHAGNKASLTVEIDGIAEIIPADFEGNRPVIDAVLHATGKRAIHEVSYSDLLNITYLDMSAKGLVSVPMVLKLAKNITHLDLRGNEFREVPEFVYALHSLKRLDLSNNNLVSIDERIGDLRNLETLDISLNYLIDYDCPIIVLNYRDAGNYTMTGRAGQYSFQFGEPESVKEYAGNTTMLPVEWSYSGQPIENGLENHRKVIYSASHNDYRSYRPAVYEYKVENGKIKHSNADYVQVYLPNSGVMSAGLAIGGVNVLVEVSEAVDILRLPEPEISGFDAENGIVFLRAAGLDTDIKADIRAAVAALDEDGGIVEASEVRVSDPDSIKVPLKTKLQKGQNVTAMLINHDVFGGETGSVNEADEVIADTGCGHSGSDGSSKTTVEYIVIEATKDNIITEKIVEVIEKPVYENNGGITGNSGNGYITIHDNEQTDKDSSSDSTPIIMDNQHSVPDDGYETDEVNGINVEGSAECTQYSVSEIVRKIIIPIIIFVLIILVIKMLFGSDKHTRKE